MSRQELPFEVIQTCKPEQLKEFCRKRDLKVSGPIAELVARLFAAAEIGIVIKPTAQERISTTEKEKAKLLIMPNGTSVPDPFDTEGWLGEGKREHNFLAADIPERYNIVINE